MNATEAIAARARLLGAAGYFDQNSDEVVPSPCVSVCRMSADGDLCEGCFRSLDEIRRWSGLDTLARRVVWSRLLQRAGAPVPDTLPVVKLP